MKSDAPSLLRSEVDRQYDTSLAVEDESAEIAHFVRTSKFARDGLVSFLDVPYGVTAAETLDIFPAADDGAPVFVFLHGGYWRGGSSKDFSSVALGLQPLGITVVVVDYALCPSVDIDEIVRQSRAALAWVHRHITEYGGDADRIVVGGHSAGGQLAAMCLSSNDVQLKGAVLISGLFDLEPLRHSYLQEHLRLDDGIIERNSPIRRVEPGATPIRMMWGKNETSEFERQSRHYAHALAAAGHAVDIEPEPAANHFTVLHALENPMSDACRWIARHLDRGLS